MIEAARRNRVKLEVGENVWRFPAERLKKRIVDAGLLGPVTQVHLQYLSGAYHGMNALRLYAGGEAKRVVGVARDVPVRPYVSYGDIPVTANTWEAGLIEFDNGVTAVYEFPARRAGTRGNYWEIDGPEGHILGNDLFLYRPGAKGDERVQYPILTETEEVGGKKVIARLRVETAPPVVWENPYVRYETAGTDDVARADQLAMMRRAIAEDVEPGYGAVQGRKDQELVIAVRASALLGGAPVDLPLKAVTAHEERLHADFREKFGCDPLSSPDQALGMFYPTIGVRQAVKN
jgi:predicted dehydrogenase